jgi:FG-GAP-like repeat
MVAHAVTVPSAGFPTVQSAINAVIAGAQPDGTVINLQAQLYPERLTIVGTARSMTIRGVAGTVINAGSSGPGPVVVVRSATGAIRFENLTLTGGSGGPNADDGGGFGITDASPTFVNCVITENSSALHGGGGALLRSNAVFQSTVIQNNQAAHTGGGVFAFGGSNPTFIASTIQNNVAGVTVGNGAGGGIGLKDASATLSATVVTGNRGKFAGGGIFSFTEFTTPFTTVLAIDGSVISGNTAEQAPGQPPTVGGGIHIEDQVIARIVRSVVSGNVAGGGGGLSSYRARFELTSAFVESNQAVDASSGAGGGILAGSSNGVLPIRPAAVTVLTDTVVRNNTAARLGGGIASAGDELCGGGPCAFADATQATLTLTASLVEGNTAAMQGAGIYTNRTQVTVSGSHVLRNSLTGGGSLSFGGGILLFASNTTITGTTIAGNASQFFGGGVFLEAGGTVLIDGSNVYGNSAGNRGGGIFVGVNPPPAGTVQSSIIADNVNFQIAEDVCPWTPGQNGGPVLNYLNNVITPRPGFGDAYHSPCNPPGDRTAAQLNTLPSGKASGNQTAVPVFASFLATPDGGATVLSWSVARASTVTINAGVGSKPGPTSSQDVPANACPQTYVLTAATFPGSVSATVLGTGGLTEFGPGVFAYAPSFSGGVFVAAADVDGQPGAEVITGAGAGGGPHVRVFRVDHATGALTAWAEFFAYDPSFLGGVFVAASNLDNQPSAEIITGAGPGGGPHLRIFRVNPSTGLATAWSEMFAYTPAFSGGVRVAAGDVNGDGRPEVITAAGAGGGPHIRVFEISPATGSLTPFTEFFAYSPTFTGGVFVAAADVDGDGPAEIITAAGLGGGPHVRVFKVNNAGNVSVFTEFFAYDPSFTGGVFVAAGQLDGTPGAEIVTGPGSGGGPDLRVYGLGRGLLQASSVYSPTFTGGVRVAAGNVDASGSGEIITGAGPGGGPHVRIFELPACP